MMFLLIIAILGFQLNLGGVWGVSPSIWGMLSKKRGGKAKAQHVTYWEGTRVSGPHAATEPRQTSGTWIDFRETLNHPFGNGLYLFMVKLGMVFYCFNHIQHLDVTTEHDNWTTKYDQWMGFWGKSARTHSHCSHTHTHIYIYVYYITLPPGHHFLAGSCKFLHHQVMGYIVEHFV